MNINIDNIYNIDCLEGMKHIPEGSVDAVICDLPYGTMKGAGLDGWKEETTDWDSIIPTDQLFENYARIIRQNGTIVLFSQEPYTMHLRSYPNKCNSRFCYPMIWKKNHFANALIAMKAPVSYFEDISIFTKPYDSNMTNPLREYFKQVLQYIGKPKMEIIKEIGQCADHVFRTDSLQFSLPTEETYNLLINTYGIDRMEGFKTISELRKNDEKNARVFNLPKGKNILSNILEFHKDNNRFHPTQKPLALMRRLVLTFTNPGDMVLDNCIGSGTTAIACIREKRHFIGFETNAEYYNKALQRINNERMQLSIF
jgi:site-specific DNA-methyltransferase (adenine-specific)